jgi:hypothetical protein
MTNYQLQSNSSQLICDTENSPKKIQNLKIFQVLGLVVPGAGVTARKTSTLKFIAIKISNVTRRICHLAEFEAQGLRREDRYCEFHNELCSGILKIAHLK